MNNGGTAYFDNTVEGYPGGSFGRGAAGNGGGGSTDGNTGANDQNSGGGGGGNGGFGGMGGWSWNSQVVSGGLGGAPFPGTAPRLILGGGGGAGTTNDGTGNDPLGFDSSGAAGGGVVMIRSNTVSGSGTINANGASANQSVANDGGGGGGAGGSVVVISRNGTVRTLTVNARGGRGGDTWDTSGPGSAGVGGGNNHHGPGGGGGGGFVFTSTSVAVTSNVAGGANGTSTTDLSAFGATPGGAGFATTAVPSDIPLSISGANCVPVSLTTIKTTSTPTVMAGNTATYTITVSNAAGAGGASGVAISDVLPINFTYASTGSVTLSGNAVRTVVNDPTPPTGTPRWDTFLIPGGGSVAITFTVNVSITTPPATYQNPATTTFLDPVRTIANTTLTSTYNPASNNGEDVTVTPPSADLTVTKTDGVASVNAGGTTTYTLTLTNNGPSLANNATISDPAVAGLTKTALGVCTPAGGAVCPTAGAGAGQMSIANLEAGTVVVPTLPNGGSISFTVIASVTAVSGSVSNTFNATPPAGTTDPTPATATDTDTVNPIADLVVTKTDGVASVNAGSATTYTVRVTNNGPSSATGAILSDPSAAGLSKTAVTCSAIPGQCVTAPTVAQLEGGAFALPALASGQFFEITVSANVTALGGSVTNSASITAPAGVTDPIPGNNTASDTDSVNPIADLSVTKTDGVASVNAGGTTTYTLTLTNNGPNPANNATISDPAVAGLTKTALGVCAAAGGAVCPPAGAGAGQLNIANLEAGSVVIPTLPSGGSISFTVTASVTAVGGSVANTFTAAPPGGTTDPTPATATDTDSVNPIADLSVTKTDGVTSVNAGGTTTYTIVVTNHGPSAADNMVFTDPAVAGLSATGVTCGTATGGAACPTVGNTTVALMQGTGIVIPTLPSGGSVTFTVDANVTATFGTVANTANVAPPAGTTDPGVFPNTATDTDTVNPIADLEVTKTDGVTSVDAGGTTTYTIVVTNHGPSAADNTVFTDPAVAGLSATGVTCGTATGGAACPTVGNTTVALMQGTGIVIPTLPSGGSVTFTVNADLTATSGTVVNTATVALPGSTTDPGVFPNTATDTNTVNPIADLAVTKTDGVASVNAGGTTTYTLTLINNGPSPANNATISDPAVAGLTKTSIGVCTPAGGAVCPTAGAGAGQLNIANLEAGLVVIPTLPSGGSISFTVTASVTAVSGSVANTFTATPLGGTTDPIPANNTATDTDTVNPIADLTVTKTDGAASVNAGGTTTYTLTLTNNGPSPANNATISDPAVAGLTKTALGVCAAAGGAVCPPAGAGAGQLNIANLEAGSVVIPTLPSGGSLSFTVTASVTAVGGSVSNTFTATPPGGTTDPTPATATDTDTVNPIADLAVTKTDGSITYIPGGTMTYIIVVSNAGPSDATGATFADTFPAVTTSAGWTCAAGGGATCPAASGTGSINATVDLPVGGSLTYTVTANISSSASGALVNTATITAPLGVTDPTPGNNSATDTDTVSTLADLSITKTDGSSTYVAGGTVVYTVTVTNGGPSDVTGATVSDIKPLNVITWAWACTSQTGGAAGCDSAASSSNDFTDTVDLPNGGTIVYTVIAGIAPAATGDLINSASISTPVGVTDPTPANNTSTDTDAATASADLSVTKTDGTTSYTAGSTTTYTIVVSNAGPSDVTGASFSDNIPIQVSSWTWACVPGIGANCSAGPTITVANFSDTVNIPVGSSITYTVVATLSASATGSLTNTATISTPSGVSDPTPGNDNATDTDTGSASADLSITKTDGSTTYNPGGSISYTIVVSNAGPSDVTGASVSDSIPADITGVTWTCAASGSGSSCTPSGSGNINDTAVNLPVGTSVTYTLTGTVSASTTSNLSNTATVSAPAGVTDPTPGNDSATDTDTRTDFIDPALTKSVDPTQAAVGDTMTFTITATNNGTVAATNVVVTDVLPDNLDYVSASSTPTGTLVLTPPRTVTVTIATLNPGDVSTITIITTVNGLGKPPVQNTASLSADPPVPGVGADPTANNSSTVPFLITSPVSFSGRGGGVMSTLWLPSTGFAPGVMTELPPQPSTAAYNAEGDIWLEIPRLGVRMPIVGIPLSGGTWDVTWISKQAGWLQGTAFPTWSGNSVLTGHVYLSNGLPGPFVNLHTLQWGDLIIIHLAGQRYIYQVRTDEVISPNDTSVFKHEDNPWLTLITCKDYDAVTGTYTHRVAVRAVFIKIEDEMPPSSGGHKR